MNLKKKLIKEISKYFDEKGAHDMSHTLRVLKTAEHIAKSEKNVDKEILIASCLLHDIARKKEDFSKIKICHAEEGARMAQAILRKIKSPEWKIQRVTDAIKCHRKSSGLKAETIEAKILQDADRLDIFGAVGIARTFAQFAGKGVIHSNKSRKLTSMKDYNTDSSLEMIRSLLLIKQNYFNTLGARKIIKQRLKFIKLFIKQFEKEWN